MERTLYLERKDREKVTVYSELPEKEVLIAVSSPIFQRFINADKAFGLSSVLITVINYKGGREVLNRPNPQVLFIRLEAMTNKGWDHIDIVELRGDSVVILPILVTREGAIWTVLVQQARLASGQHELFEVPAGMIEGENFRNDALRELQEELDMVIDPRSLFNLQDYVKSEENQGLLSSPGLLDEKIRFCGFIQKITFEQIQAMAGKQTGLASEGERIILRPTLLEDLVLTQDMKAVAAYALFKKWLQLSDSIWAHMFRRS